MLMTEEIEEMQRVEHDVPPCKRPRVCCDDLVSDDDSYALGEALDNGIAMSVSHRHGIAFGSKGDFREFVDVSNITRARAWQMQRKRPQGKALLLENAPARSLRSVTNRCKSALSAVVSEPSRSGRKKLSSM